LDYNPEDPDPKSTKEWRRNNDITVVGMGVEPPPPILTFEDAPFNRKQFLLLSVLFS
jgi:hypothetical protein